MPRQQYAARRCPLRSLIGVLHRFVDVLHQIVLLEGREGFDERWRVGCFGRKEDGEEGVGRGRLYRTVNFALTIVESAASGPLHQYAESRMVDPPGRGPKRQLSRLCMHVRASTVDLRWREARTLTAALSLPALPPLPADLLEVAEARRARIAPPRGACPRRTGRCRCVGKRLRAASA